jgi:uncharacterized protein (TIGR02147 family)
MEYVHYTDYFFLYTYSKQVIWKKGQYFIFTNPAKLDKSLFAGIIYAKRIDNSATVTKEECMKSGLPNIYAYNNFRTFLVDYQEARKKTEPKFSKSEFSRSLQLPNTRSYLNDILRGKKVSEIFLERIITAIGFDKEESQYFRTLVRFNQSGNQEEREFFFEQLISLNRTPKRILDKDILVYYSKWYHSVIRALLAMYDFKDDYAWLAKQLVPQIKAKEAGAAIELLSRLGIIQRNSAGFLKPTEKSIAAPENIRDELIRHFQLKFLSLGQTALSQGKKAISYSSNNTISVSEEGYKRLVKLTRKFQDQARSLVHKDEKLPSKVYNVSIVMFPLSK